MIKRYYNQTNKKLKNVENNEIQEFFVLRFKKCSYLVLNDENGNQKSFK